LGVIPTTMCVCLHNLRSQPHTCACIVSSCSQGSSPVVLMSSSTPSPSSSPLRPTPAPAPMPTPPQAAVPPPTPTPTPTPTPGGAPEIVVNLGKTPAKIKLTGATKAADIGTVGGASTPVLITAAKAGKQLEWRWSNIQTGASTLLMSIPGAGVPVVGCYVNNTYTPAMFVKGDSSQKIKLYSANTPAEIELPEGTVMVRCGAPVNGKSAMFSLVQSSDRRTSTVVGKSGSVVIGKSKRIDPGLNVLSLGIVPRARGQQPTAMILVRQGRTRLVQVLNRSNKWTTVSIPNIPAGSVITNIVGVRLGDTTYIVTQVTDMAKSTSYRVVVVPASTL